MEEETTHNGKGKGISLEEQSLWERSVEDVTKLRRNKHIVVPPAMQSYHPSAPLSIPAPLPAPYNLDSRIHISLEKRQAKKIRQGKIYLDATIDLHGFTEAKAYEHLLRRLDLVWQHGKRCILVVTGKGPDGSGILAQRVPQWLSTPKLRGRIIKIAEALPHHGGSGALYVFLKRR